ncbi:MAG: hypothetical protein ACUVTB_07685 [Candidatus Bathycorpusculaceae bacterium]
MLTLRRRIYTLDCSFLKEFPGKIGKVIEILAKENVGIMGGFAKILLGEILKSQGRIMENLALGYKSEVDLDLVTPFLGPKRENIDKISKRIKELQKKLLGIGVDVDEEDVKLFEGNFEDRESLRKFLESFDLTMNELVFIPSQLTLFLTNKCFRDTISGVGILSANHPGTLRRDCGRIIASPRGMARLIRFLVEEKVKSIYLPHWWVESNKEEAERLGKGVLGTYGLLLAERYKDNEILQTKFMKILNDLSITNLKKFETFKKEQLLLFEAERGEKFEIKKRTFKEVQEEMLEKEELKEIQKKEEKEKREECSHREKKVFTCHYCHWECKIEKCLNCDRSQITPKGWLKPAPLDAIFCNRNLIKANVYWDKNGFFPIFPQNKKKRGFEVCIRGLHIRP